MRVIKYMFYFFIAIKVVPGAYLVRAVIEPAPVINPVVINKLIGTPDEFLASFDIGKSDGNVGRGRDWKYG